jgi:hypothetical protein
MRNSAHAISALMHIPVPLGICGNDVIQSMLPAINFDDELVLLAIEVGNVPTDRRLAAKLQPIELAIAQAPPHLALPEAWLAAEALSARKGTRRPISRCVSCDHAEFPPPPKHPTTRAEKSVA